MVATQLIDTVADFLDAESWSYARIEGKTALVFRFEGKHGEWTCQAKTLEQRGQVVCYSICPVAVSEAQFPEVTEFIARANDGLIIGNFELSYTTGQLRFKTSIDVEGETLGRLVVKHLIYDNMFTMDRYLPAFYNVLENQATPIQAIAHAEARQDKN